MRLMFLAPFRPLSAGRHGGARVTGQLLRELARRHDVAVVHFDDPPAAGDDELAALGVRSEPVPLPAPIAGIRGRTAAKLRLLRGLPTRAGELRSDAFMRAVRAVAAEWAPDVVQIEYPVLGRYLSALDGCPAPRVLVDYDATLRDARRWGGPLPALTAALDERAWRRYKRRAIERVDAVVVFTERDARTLAELGARAPVVRIAPGTTLPADQAGGGADSGMLFVGNFQHPPNVDAAVRLARQVVPPLRATHPDAVLTIVGPAPPPEVRRLAGPGVVVTGEVRDVAPYLRDAAVVVAPLRVGGGIRIKVLEALAAGKAVVASRLAAEGLDVVPGRHLEIADSDEELRRAVARLLDAPERRRALGEQARAWAQANLSWDAAAAAYERLYRSLLEASSAPEGPPQAVPHEAP